MVSERIMFGLSVLMLAIAVVILFLTVGALDHPAPHGSIGTATSATR